MRGFTLLELMTTITIISILVATGVPAFANYQRHNSIRIASQDVKSFLVEARTLSLNPRPEDKGREYYFVTIDSSSGEPTISLGVGDGPSIKGPIGLGNDVEVKQGVGDYAFKIPSGDPDFPGTDTTAIIKLWLADERGGEDVFRQTIVTDGIGGDVKVNEGRQ